MTELPASVRRFTALARVVDPSRPSNRFAILVTVVGFVATLVGRLLGGAGALGPAVAGGVGAFLAWAIARELDPDRTRTARDAGLGALALLLLGTPDVAALLAVLLALRVVTRSAGSRPRVPDMIATVVVAWASASDPTGVVAAFGLAGALVWDTRLPVRAPRTSGLVGAIVLSAGVVAAILGGALLAGWGAPGVVDAAVLVAAMAAAGRLPPPAVTSRADSTNEVLHPERIRASRVLTGLVLAGTLVWVGAPATAALGGAWAAFIATGLAGWRVRGLPRETPRDDGHDQRRPGADLPEADTGT